MPDARLDEPTEGLPPYLLGPVAQWLDSISYDGYDTGAYRDQALTRLQLRFKLDPPLDFRQGGASAVRDLIQRMNADHEFGLDVVDYVLHHMNEFTDRYTRPIENAAKVHGILTTGGSAWEVVSRAPDEQSFGLSRRAVGPVADVIESLTPTSRAHSHLVTAWNRLSGRQPDASTAYREAIRAVEAVAKPVILPTNDRATLGTMIAAMRDKPEKWEVTLGSLDEVRQMMEMVWTNQLDRHGTDDESVPLNVSLDEADVAVHVCIALVRMFAGDHVRTR